MKQRQVAVLCWLAIIDFGLVMTAINTRVQPVPLGIVLAVWTVVAVGLAGGKST